MAVAAIVLAPAAAPQFVQQGSKLVGWDAAAALVELLDGVGAKLADYTVSLPARRSAQETQPYLNKARQPAMDRGYARVTVQAGSGVFAFASVIDNLTNDPTTVAMQR